MRRRGKTLRIRISDQEREAIDRAASASALGPSTFARMATVQAAGRKPAPPPRRRPDSHSVALGRWTGELSRIGGNLNQLAHAANTGSQVDAAALEALRVVILELRETVLKFHTEPPPDES